MANHTCTCVRVCVGPHWLYAQSSPPFPLHPMWLTLLTVRRQQGRRGQGVGQRHPLPEPPAGPPCCGAEPAVCLLHGRADCRGGKATAEQSMLPACRTAGPGCQGESVCVRPVTQGALASVRSSSSPQRVRAGPPVALFTTHTIHSFCETSSARRSGQPSRRGSTQVGKDLGSGCTARGASSQSRVGCVGGNLLAPASSTHIRTDKPAAAQAVGLVVALNTLPATPVALFDLGGNSGAPRAPAAAAPA